MRALDKKLWRNIWICACSFWPCWRWWRSGNPVFVSMSTTMSNLSRSRDDF